MKNIPLVLATAVAGEVGSEKILWADAPDGWSCARQHWRTALFGIPFTAFSIFWTWGAAGGMAKNGKSAPPFFILWGLMFVAIGLSLLLSPLHAAWKGSRAFYVVTEKRAIIFERGWRLNIRSFDASGFGGFERISRGDSAGDLIFQRNIERRGKGTSVTEVGFIGLSDYAPAEVALRKMIECKRQPG